MEDGATASIAQRRRSRFEPRFERHARSAYMIAGSANCMADGAWPQRQAQGRLENRWKR